MASYSYEYRENGFPNTLIDMPTFRNITDAVAEMINSIDTLRANGQYEAAASKIKAYGDALKPYIFDANTVNAIIEEIRNTQIKCLQETQVVYLNDNEPTTITNGDVWIGTVDPDSWG